MPSIKQDGNVWTLRNTKGNELKVSENGARVVSMRFRDKGFTNRFLLKDDASKVFVDGAACDILWHGEQTDEGVKFTADINGKSACIIYSLSNDNEISIRYAADVNDITTQLVFDGNVLPDVDIRGCQKGAAWEKISGAKTYPVTEPAEVMMEVGMFGYDPGCPIDYLDGGLKNAANLFCDGASIEIIVYATQDSITAEAVDGGFALKTAGASKGQTVYMLKNRK